MIADRRHRVCTVARTDFVDDAFRNAREPLGLEVSHDVVKRGRNAGLHRTLQVIRQFGHDKGDAMRVDGFASRCF